MKYLITSLLLSVAFFLNAQLKIVNSSLLELEQNVYNKSFSKKWKKTKQADWEIKVKEAKDITTLNTLFNEYSDLLAQSASFSMGNSDATTELEFAKYLMKVDGTLSGDIISKWDESARKKWKFNLTEFIDAEEQKFKEEELMRKFHVVTTIVKGFEKNFPVVWADAKKNAFKSIMKGDGKVTEDNTTINFKGGAGEVIVVDDYGVKSFVVNFDAEEDEQLSEKIMTELEMVIISEVGAGYKKTNMMDATFAGSNKFVYQFEGEKFSETAKRPTVTIGVKKDRSGVYLQVTEPVFGH